MPSSLVYEFILNLVEAGEFEKAEALFHNRFFHREEGGTNVREVWLEVQILHALSLSEHGRCSDAVQIVDHLADPVPSLDFTHDGLEPFLSSARFRYLGGLAHAKCNLADQARKDFEEASRHQNPGDAIWSWKAAQHLPDINRDAANRKLKELREQMDNAGEDDSPSGRWFYNAGMLDQATGNAQKAESEFREAFLSPTNPCSTTSPGSRALEEINSCRYSKRQFAS